MNSVSQEQIYKEISETIVNLDREKALELTDKIINENLNILDVIEKGFRPGIQRVGELWDEGDFFLPELMMGAKIMQDCLDVLMPHLKIGEEREILGKVVIATIEGDIHSIGKTIVASMLRAFGFEVYDLGTDVPVEKIIDEAVNRNADIIGVSALLTTTMIGQKKIIELLKQKGLADKFKVILGGAPVTGNWVEECGANGFAENAVEAVKLAKSLLKN